MRQKRIGLHLTADVAPGSRWEALRLTRSSESLGDGLNS